jgi:hypothetical protein
MTSDKGKLLGEHYLPEQQDRSTVQGDISIPNDLPNHPDRQQGGPKFMPMFDTQPINGIGPNFNILTATEEHNSNSGQVQGQEHPALFGQNQLKDGLGPVYAVPSFPKKHTHGNGGEQWPQQGGQIHPALFDQDQLKGGLGPIYAVPSFPGQYGHKQYWNHGYDQTMGSGQWIGHPKVTVLCCPFCMPGHRYY